tara:strand:+ start:204504 stop:206414 length:1911 start_codon:yes stop_codon:yes gene_type:complete
MIKIGDVVEGSIQMNKFGSAYLTSDNLKKDIYIHKKNTNKSLHLDNVKVEVIKGVNRAMEGVVTDVVERFKNTFVGTIQINNGFGFLIADSDKMPFDLFIPQIKLMGATNGQKVVGKFVDWLDGMKTPNGEIIEILGDINDKDVQMNSIVHQYELSEHFNEDVEAESNKISNTISQEEIGKRLDLRDILTFTIDPDTAKDFDDALSYEDLPNGDFKVGIHIADVSHYVRPGTELDKEAYDRGTSIYLVDRVIPMLPERLSNGVCSLRPHEDKLTFSAIFTFNKNYEVIDEWFGRTVIHSDHRLTYGEAENLILLSKPTSDDEMESVLPVINDVAKELRSIRDDNGAITFERDELKFYTNRVGKLDIMVKPTLSSNILIEEFMLLANTRVAKYLRIKNTPSVNRIHEKPNLEKLKEVEKTLKEFGHFVDLESPEHLKNNINMLLRVVKGEDDENLVNSLLLRSMQKAVYSTDNIGHFGLSFKDYTHFTSPIRRYSDIMVHRILNRVLENKTKHKETKLSSRCSHLSNMEVRAQKASRESIKYKQCGYMEDRVGKVYTGTVISVNNQGLYINIMGTNCEGFINMDKINSDDYSIGENGISIIGKKTDNIITLGDKITVIVKSVDLIRKTVHLSLLKLK